MTEPITGIIQMLTAGQRPCPHFTPQMLDEMNAQHSKEFASCTKSETVALLRTGAAEAAEAVRTLSDAELTQSGTVFRGNALMSAEDMVQRALLGHIDEHFGGIRRTVGC